MKHWLIAMILKDAKYSLQTPRVSSEITMALITEQMVDLQSPRVPGVLTFITYSFPYIVPSFLAFEFDG